jgi:hypothetical protein
VRNPIAEGIANSGPIWGEAVGRNFRRAEHTAPQVLNEQVRILAIALANAIADDGLRVSSHPDENVLVAFAEKLITLRASLLLADEAPQLVQLNPIHPDAVHGPVVKLRA